MNNRLNANAEHDLGNFAEDTAEFQKWFSGSTVVDTNGNPKIVYHGTGGDIRIFDNSLAPSGLDKNALGAIWFSTAPEVASGFAGHQRGERIAGVQLGHSNVIPAYVALSNPYEDDNGYYARGGGLCRDQIEELKADGYDGVIWRQSDADLPDTTSDGPVQGYYRNRFGEAWGESQEGYPDQIAVFDMSQIRFACICRPIVDAMVAQQSADLEQGTTLEQKRRRRP